MQQPRNTTKLYRLPPNVIYFLFYCKSNLFFIFWIKTSTKWFIKISFLLQFCILQTFLNGILKISFCHMKREIADNREYFAKQNDIFPRKWLFLYNQTKKCGIPDATESYSFQSVFTTFCKEINHWCMPENITSVLIIYTGGTIGMVENSKTGSLEPFNFHHLLDKVPELRQLGFSISTVQFEPDRKSVV